VIVAGLSSAQAAATAADHKELFEGLPPWAEGSPEEIHLRTHLDYLAPGIRGKIWLIVNLAYSALAQLIPVAAAALLVAILLGYAYSPWLLEAVQDSSATVSFKYVYIALASLSVLVLCCVGAWRRWERGHRPRVEVGKRTESYAVNLVFLQLATLVVLVILPKLILYFHWHPPFGFHGATGIAAVEVALLLSLFAAAYLSRRWPVVSPLLPLLSLVFFAIPVVGIAQWQIERNRLSALSIGLTLGSGIALLVFSFSDQQMSVAHSFYRDRLSYAFVGRRSKRTAWNREVLVFEQPQVPMSIRFSDLAGLQVPAADAFPNLIVCAAVNGSDGLATGRRAASFTFERDRTGGPATGYASTLMMEEESEAMTLPGMMALSGAAVSPSMGSMTIRWLRPFLFVFGVRLGMWVPNPSYMTSRDSRQAFGRILPGSGYFLREALGWNSFRGRFVYVTDGGHWENLGLVELLRRGCGQILCLDASGDRPVGYSSLSNAIALARTELGVSIEIDPSPFQSDEEGFSSSSHVIGRIRYPDGTDGVLVVAKTVLAESLPHDVISFRGRARRFPSDPTSNLFYTDEKFEAYRVLGQQAAQSAIRALDELAGPV
jgi:hypothetical protein